MDWVVVPCLDEGRDQLNERFPNRDKSSDGSVGDLAHQGSSSSHNPDKTGNPEYRDGDSNDEIRARDFDADLRDPNGVTMEQVVQLWVTLARSGVLWWIRYIIYNGRIWHRRDGFVTRAYTGRNKHDKHAHVNSDFTKAADEARGTNWHLSDLGLTPTPKPPTTGTRELRQGLRGEDVGRLQQFFRNNFPVYRNFVNVKRGQLLSVDKDFGPQTKAWVIEFQRRTGLARDGIVGPNTRSRLAKYGYKP